MASEVQVQGVGHIYFILEGGPGGIALGRGRVRAPDTAARAAPRPPPLPAAPRAVYTDSDVNK